MLDVRERGGMKRDDLLVQPDAHTRRLCRAAVLRVVCVLVALLGQPGLVVGAPGTAFPRVACVSADHAVLRVGPSTDHDRRTPLERGTLLLVRERRGGWLRADLGNGDAGWLEEKEVVWPPGVRSADAQLCNVLVRPGAGETRIDVQLTARTSFDVVESVEPPALVVRLHRTTSRIHELAQFCPNTLVGAATVRQVAPQVVELRFPLARRGAWGYRLGYGASPNLPTDPPGHDFRHVSPENLRIALAHPPDLLVRGALAEGRALQGITVVVDPGHGGDDPGAVGVGGLVEKDINLAVSLALRQSLERRGARVVLTHDADRAVAPRADDELSARVECGRAAAGDLFISVHHNARPRIDDSRVACGVFVYYYQPWSADLARALVDPLADAQSQPTRAFVFRSFAVTRQTFMPSVLLEVGFISNPEEEQKMRAPDYPQRVAEGVARGLEGWFRERRERP